MLPQTWIPSFLRLYHRSDLSAVRSLTNHSLLSSENETFWRIRVVSLEFLCWLAYSDIDMERQDLSLRIFFEFEADTVFFCSDDIKVFLSIAILFTSKKEMFRPCSWSEELEETALGLGLGGSLRWDHKFCYWRRPWPDASGVWLSIMYSFISWLSLERDINY